MSNSVGERASLPRLHAAAALAVLLVSLQAQPVRAVQPGIDHDPLECIPITNFSAFDADVTPPDGIESCRLYFRSNIAPDFYYVDMLVTLDEGLFRAYLPKPTSETSTVEYYLECLDRDFANARTLNQLVDVVEDENQCNRRRRPLAYFTGEDPGIVVTAVGENAPAFPPGFSRVGLISAAGSNSGRTLGIAIGAGAAAGVTLALLGGGDDAPAQQPLANAPPPPPMGPMPMDTGAPLRACFTTEPGDGNLEAGGAITLDGSCSTPSGGVSYEWDLGDGRMRTGMSVRPTYRNPGEFDVKLTVRRLGDPSASDETEMPVSVVLGRADMAIQKRAQSICTEEEERVAFTLDVVNNGPSTARNVIVTDSLPGEFTVLRVDGGPCSISGNDVRCELGDMAPQDREMIVIVAKSSFGGFDFETLQAQLPVNIARVKSDSEDPVPSNNEADVFFESGFGCGFDEEQKSGSPTIVLASHLQLPNGAGVTGGGQLNESRSFVVLAGAPTESRLEAAWGRNVVDAYLTGDAGGEGRWSFEVRGAVRIAPGSLRAESGDVVSVTDRAVVFRVRRGANRIRFSFQLRR